MVIRRWITSRFRTSIERALRRFLVLVAEEAGLEIEHQSP
jgi:hypothetical protein